MLSTVRLIFEVDILGHVCPEFALSALFQDDCTEELENIFKKNLEGTGHNLVEVSVYGGVYFTMEPATMDNIDSQVKNIESIIKETSNMFCNLYNVSKLIALWEKFEKLREQYTLASDYKKLSQSQLVFSYLVERHRRKLGVESY